ncbi:hypothetical protein I317_04401 [Kwoniella heveanensis CBS 569]|uniref:S1-like domain-containing protein n=1 Tax=Kwoniella heveanensis BCC8398 TaxID=1296120 RepID=A0A1B9GH86_9TREE|nr:hypothetical protein I316_07937 [Kwoniella heveanensis BCC8398]OCF41795.1 hypothetical protein I317_04401 [Kwoniella heveanensis CBS 569]
MPRRPPSPPSFTPPLPADQHLVQLTSPQGSNNFLCVDTKDVERLVEISSKLRRIKTLIVMRGDFAIISLYPTTEKGGRLVGEIVHILDKGDIREWKKSGYWPEGFGEKPAPVPDEEDPSEPEEDDNASHDQEEEHVDRE